MRREHRSRFGGFVVIYMYKFIHLCKLTGLPRSTVRQQSGERRICRLDGALTALSARLRAGIALRRQGGRLRRR